MSQNKRDLDAMIQQTKRNPNLTARQRQSRLQGLLSEKRLQSQRAQNAAPSQSRGAPAPKQDVPRRKRKPNAKRKPTSMPKIDEQMKKLGIY